MTREELVSTTQEQLENGQLPELFERYTTRLAAFAARRASPEVLQRVQIEDIVQETLLGAWTIMRPARGENSASVAGGEVGRPHQFQSDGKPRAFRRWMCAILSNRIRDIADRRAELAWTADVDEAITMVERADEPTPDSVIRTEEVVLLERALNGLRPVHREVLQRHFLGGMTFRAIAAELGESDEKWFRAKEQGLRALRLGLYALDRGIREAHRDIPAHDEVRRPPEGAQDT